MMPRLEPTIKVSKDDKLAGCIRVKCAIVNVWPGGDIGSIIVHYLNDVAPSGGVG